jgi:hypothetical protein
MLRRRSAEHSPPNVDRELAERLERLRGICFCVLYDLCSWMAVARLGVPPDIAEYALADVGGLADPVERMRCYVDEELIESWATALQPFFERGLRLRPELGDTGPLREEGLEDKREVKAEVRFHNRSTLVDREEQRMPLPRREWVLQLWVSPDLVRIVDARLGPAEQ